MQINLTIEPDQIVRAWAVYTLQDSTGTIQYIGHCRLAQLSSTPDARAHSLFKQIFPAGRAMTLNVLQLTQKQHLARNVMWQYIQTNGRPFMLAHGLRAGMRGCMVTCNETGEVFNTLVAACEAHGLSQSHLSAHLANKPGCAHVKGKTYTRGRIAT